MIIRAQKNTASLHLKRKYLTTIHRVLVRKAMRTPDTIKKREFFEHAEELCHALRKIEAPRECGRMFWEEDIKDRFYDV